MTIEEILKRLDSILIKAHDKHKWGAKPMIYLNRKEERAISEIRDRLIKIKPNDVFMDFGSGLLLGWCPRCNKPVDSHNQYCSECNQALDWKG